MTESLIQVKNLKMYFPIRGGVFYRQIGSVYAVDDVSFNIKQGETLGLVGESGCGKTTVGRSLLNLYKPTGGEVCFNGIRLSGLKREDLRKLRQEMQIIFQDPYESLNSRHTIYNILEEPFVIHNIGNQNERKEEVKSLLNRVGLSQSAMNLFPHEFSGGQRQRIGIARAIALKPKFIICDEPVSALDVSIQSQILNLLMELQQEMHLTYLFISHDLTVVRHISDRIAVMYLGKIVELTNSDAIYENPLHPYTKALISAIPRPDPSLRNKGIILKGDVPSPKNPPSGCYFHTRCPNMKDICTKEYPSLTNFNNSRDQEHLIACHFAGKTD